MQAAKQLEAVREILRAISAMPFDLDGALRIVVERAADLCQADYGYVFVPAGDAYRLAAQHGGSPEQEQYERDHPSPVTRQTVVGRVVISGEPVQIEDVLSDPDYQWQEGQRLGEFRTLLGVPVRTQDRLVGVFGLARTSVRSFSEADIELVQTFADQAAIVIENVRLMGTIERQREELARYVPSTVAKLIANAEGEQLLAGHRREVSVVFCDLRGFTQFAEEAEPEEVLEILR
ncbi:MAG TPA: GAF domain-containing protein, partial [Candidatus Limnocylindrales bacterium]|nr:GAF domain-containing protein [Candidatus Limnocylindrales bacterium]